MSREEKRDKTAVSQGPFLVLTVTFIRRERSSAGRFAKISFGGGFRRVCPDLQVDSRTRMRPSSNWISGAFHVGVWSNQSGSGSLGFRGRLNQSRSGSSSGIHSLIACQGGSIGSMVSMSKGGGGGRGSVTIPSQRPWRRRKNSISSRRMTLRTGFIVPLQQGHCSGSPPQTWRIRSRQSGRMSRADCFGGAGMRRISD